MDFFERVRYKTEQNNMIAQGDYVIAGVSGGADSVCLLCMLVRLQKSSFSQEPLFELSALHVNHGIRGAEAARDEEFVKQLCGQLGVKLKTVHADVPALAKEKHLSTEEAGRLVRHEAFAEQAQKLKEAGYNVKAALAHHMDDRAETVLHNMMRGSALKGLAGIYPVNEMEGGYTIIRPLLDVRRSEIEEWLAKQGQTFCTDSTNADDKYTRNRLRNAVIPMLEKNINANAVRNITQAAEFVREAESYISRMAYEAFEECREQTRIYEKNEDGTNKKIYINILKLRKKDSIIQKYAVYYALTEIAKKTKDICAVHVADVMALMDKKSGSAVNLPYFVTARREYDIICISRGGIGLPEYIWYAKDGLYHADKELTVEIVHEKNHSALQENDYTKCINCDKIKTNLLLRTRCEGDYISVYSDGRTKKLKDYFIDQKIPLEYRDRVLLVADGSEIVWIVGFRVSEKYKAEESTQHKAYVKINGFKLLQNAD